MKPSRRQTRWTLVLVALVVVGAAAGGLYAWRQHAYAQRVAAWRVDGMKLAAQDQYKPAMMKLGPYLHEHPDDVEALRAYARARQQVKEPRGKHLVQAIQLDQRVLQLDPGDRATRQRLLKLYDKVGYKTETVDLADKILADQPDQPDAIRLKARALARLRKYDKAQKLAEKYNKLKPDDLEGQMMTLSIMRGAGRPGEAVLQRARVLSSAHADNPLYAMLVGYAQQSGGHPRAALDAYEKAGAAVLDKPAMLQRLVRLYDQLNQPERALLLLRKAADQHPSPRVLDMLVGRLWQRRGLDEIINRLGKRKPQAIPDQALALLGVLRIRRGEPGKAQAVIDALASRKDAPTAQAWADVLEAMKEQKTQHFASLIAAEEAGLQQMPGNPYLLMMLGNARAQDGDTERALAHWRRAAAAAPGWADPLANSAKLLLDTHRTRMAAAAARGALQREPGNVRAAMVFAFVAATRMDQLSEAGKQKLSDMLDRLDRAGAAGPMLPVRVAMLARRGDKKTAAQRIRDALGAKPPPPPGELRRLARVSRAMGLGMEKACFQAMGDPDQLDPADALARALWLDRSGGSGAAGRGYLQRLADHAPAQRQAAWRVAVARYLDRADPDAAQAAWRGVVDHARGRRRSLQAALDSPTVWRDRDLADRAIEKLKAIGGGDDPAWRIARGRWLLAGKPAKSDLAAATSLLVDAAKQAPYLAQPQLLLSRCFKLLDNPARELKALNKAQSLRPQSTAIAMGRAAVLEQLGRGDQARGITTDLLKSGRLAPGQQFEAARRLARLGQVAQARAAAEQLTQQGGKKNPAAWLLLAGLSERQGDAGAAARAYHTALDKSPGDPQVLLSVAAFEARRHEDKAADALVARLKALPGDQGRRDVTLGKYHQARGQTKQAFAAYRRAIKANPKLPDPRQAIAALQVRAGDVEKALASAKEAIQHDAATPGLRALADHRALVKRVHDVPLARPILSALLTSDEHREAATRTLRALADAVRQNQPLSTTATRMAQVADRNPRFLPAQMLTIDFFQRLGRGRQALDRARDLMRRFPDEAGPARVAAQVAQRLHDTGDALAAARAWRDRAAGDDPASADAARLLIAQVQIQLGRADAAARAMAKLRQHAADPAVARQALLLQARARIDGGHADQAAALLQPKLAQSKSRRAVWIQFASRVIPDADTAGDWLKQVAPLIPEGDAQRIDLAGAWWTLYQRLPVKAGPAAADRALALLKPMTGAKAPHAARALEMLGIIHGARDQTDAAVAAYQRALELDPQRTLAANNLANILMDRGRLARAQALAQKVVRQAPRVAAYQDTLGTVLVRRKKYPKAEQAMRRAVQLEPRNIKWYLHLGDVLVKADKLDQAQALLQKIDKALPDPSALPTELRQQLQRLRRAATSVSAAARGATPAPTPASPAGA